MSNYQEVFYAIIVLLVVIVAGFGLVLARVEARFNILEKKVDESGKTNEKQSVRITRVESRIKAVVKHLNIEDPVPPTAEIPIVTKPVAA